MGSLDLMQLAASLQYINRGKVGEDACSQLWALARSGQITQTQFECIIKMLVIKMGESNER